MPQLFGKPGGSEKKNIKKYCLAFQTHWNHKSSGVGKR
jgi:hypothetical protein